MSDEQEQCGAIKGNGEPCDYEPKYADGKCGHHSSETEKGRPTKFNDDRAHLAIEAALDGKSEAGCERAAGIGQGTLAGEGAWLDQGHMYETESGLLANFSQAFAQARAEGEDGWIDEGRGKDGNSPFAKFMLASSYDYKKTEQREHNVDMDADHTFDAAEGVSATFVTYSAVDGDAPEEDADVED